jgi:hypothetical protein
MVTDARGRTEDKIKRITVFTGDQELSFSDGGDGAGRITVRSSGGNAAEEEVKLPAVVHGVKRAVGAVRDDDTVVGKEQENKSIPITSQTATPVTDSSHNTAEHVGSDSDLSVDEKNRKTKQALKAVLSGENAHFIQAFQKWNVIRTHTLGRICLTNRKKWSNAVFSHTLCIKVQKWRKV